MSVWTAGSGSQFDAVRFTSSWILPPSVLFFLRALFSLFIFVSIFTILGINSPIEKRHYFSYFTSLTFFGLGFYFAFAALHTGTYWLTGKPLLARWPKALQTMHSMLYSSIVVYPFIVTIVYWALLFTNFTDDFEIFRNVSQHVFNSIFALFEITIPRTNPMPWIHLVVLVIVIALYLGLAFLTYGTQHFYVYSFLDDRIHSRGIVAGYILGILALVVVSFVIIHYLLVSRQWLVEKKLGMHGKLSTKSVYTRPTDTETGATDKSRPQVDMRQT